MNIQIDSREKSKAIVKILDQFKKQGINYFVSKLYVGDYMNLDNPKVIIDRKQNLSEIYLNVSHEHERFRNELLRAKQAGIKIIILCEHGFSVSTLEDVKTWVNPQQKKSPYAWNGERLYKVLLSIKEKYNVDFVFCSKSQTGSMIIDILQNT